MEYREALLSAATKAAFYSAMRGEMTAVILTAQPLVTS